MNENINKKVLFDSIFIKTHSELITLNNEFNELYKHYNTIKDNNELIDDNDELFIEVQSNNNDNDDDIVEQINNFEFGCFIQQEIISFQQIYQANSIQNFIEYKEKKEN